MREPSLMVAVVRLMVSRGNGNRQRREAAYHVILSGLWYGHKVSSVAAAAAAAAYV